MGEKINFMDHISINKNKLECALFYQSIGLSIIPTGPDKKPLISSWKPYQEKISTIEEIKKWWEMWPSANPALVTGKISGIVVLDLDSKYGRTSKEFNIPTTICARSGNGGEHFFFKYPYGSYVKSGSAISGEGVDCRGDGGYILLAPSINEKGGKYEWIISLESKNDLAEMPAWFKEISSKQNVIEKDWNLSLNDTLEGNRNDTATSIIGKLLKHMPRETWDGLCWSILQSINKEKFKPPLSGDELHRTFESIKSLESRNYNKNLEIKDISPSLSLKELLEAKFPEAVWLVGSLFESGTINMLSAPPNQYKSWIILLISIAVAKGVPLFDKFETTKQALMIINEEDTARLLQERLNMLLETQEDLPIYFHIGKAIKIEESFIDLIIKQAVEKNIKVIIFDSLRSVHDADENSSQEMQKIMNQLKRIMAVGISVIFTHHNRKKTFAKNNDNLGEESRGSSAINAAIHGHLSCEGEEREGKKYIVIRQPKLKAAEKISPFELRIEKDQENNKIKFIYEGEYNPKEARYNQTKEKILEIFDKSSTWLSVKNLVTQNVGGETTVRNILKILEAESLLQSKLRKNAEKEGLPLIELEGKHNEKVYFRLTEEDNESKTLLDGF